MRYALLVAWREYAENAKTKGFWISLFLLPAILFLSAQVPIWLEEKATPVRYFVLVDQSGSFAPVVKSAMDRAHQKRLLAALQQYARKNSSVPAGSPASSGVADGFGDFNEPSSQALDAFTAKGGKDYFLAQLQPNLKPGAPAFIEPRRPFQAVELPSGVKPDSDLASLAQDLKPYLRGQKQVWTDGHPVELSAAILIPRDIENHIIRPGARPAKPQRLVAPEPSEGRSEGESPATRRSTPGTASQIQYWSANTSDPKLREEIERTINGEIRRREYLARGLDAAAIRQVEQTYAPFAALNPKKETGQEAVSTADTIRQWAPAGFVYLLWIAIFAISQMLLNNIIEEKSNRIIEVLLSSVTPGELMLGKLLGIAAIGLTMIGAWMLALFGILSWKTGGAPTLAGQLLTVLNSSSLIPQFATYFLLGYLLYAAVFLSLGSVCNTLKEAQSYLSVLTMVMIVPLLTMMFIPKDPNGTLARVLSWIPFYTPFTMMNRAAADPPLFDRIGTLLLLLATTAAALWMTGKIFRIGILRTGQPPKIIEMVRWALRRET